MSTGLVVLVVLGTAVLGALVYFGGVYNNLVQVRNNVDKAWANIDVLLLQRNEELTKLVDVCRAYMEHEKDVLSDLTEMRTRYEREKEMDRKLAIENEIQAGMQRLRHVWEAYPQLRSTENFQQLQGRVSEVETSLAQRRELFNDAVNIYNIRIETIPDLLLASLLRYRRKPLLEVPEEKKKDVVMDFRRQREGEPAVS